MFNPDLDAKNTLPFLAYTNPTAYQHLIQLTVRKCDSYDCLPFKSDLDAIFDVLGIQNTYAINYRSDNVGHWSTRHGGERVVLNDGRTFPVPQFRYIDFLNVLLGSYRAGTSVALTDKNQNTKKENHKNAIRNIRIDFQIDTYSGIAATRLAIELRTKLATVGLDSFFVISGGIGVQVIIPLPCTLTMESARRLWVRLQPYLETESATLIKCSVRDFLRLPLGRDAQTGLIGLYFSPEDEMYVSPLEQISYFLKSWKWTKPSHINNAINESTFFEESKKGFSFIPEPKFVTVVDSPGSKIMPSDCVAPYVMVKTQIRRDTASVQQGQNNMNPGFHRHPNGGGLVEDTAYVAETAYVGPTAMVRDRAQVLDNAHIGGVSRISGNAIVGGDARVDERAQIHSNACLKGFAHVSGDAQVYGKARVYGNVRIYGNAVLRGESHGYGNAQILGNAEIYGDSYVYGNANVLGSASISGSARVFDDAHVHGSSSICDAHVFGKSEVCGYVEIDGPAKIYGSAHICGDNPPAEEHLQWGWRRLTITGAAHVFGNARVYGTARISDNVKIFGRAHVCGRAQVMHFAEIQGTANINGDVIVGQHDTIIRGHLPVPKAYWER
jgi:hypothetical protein